MYSIAALNQILARVEANKTNLLVDTKYVSDMIKWYITIRMTILKIITKISKFMRRRNEDYNYCKLTQRGDF